MNGLLKFCFKYGAGLSGLAAFLFLSIHKQWLKSDAFYELSQRQIFISFIVSSALAFLLCIFLIIVNYREKKSAEARQIKITASGRNSIAVSNSGNGNVSINKEH